MSKKDLVIYLASGKETLSKALFVSEERREFIHDLIRDFLHPLKNSGDVSQNLKTISESAENVQELVYFVYMYASMYASMGKNFEKFIEYLLRPKRFEA